MNDINTDVENTEESPVAESKACAAEKTIDMISRSADSAGDLAESVDDTIVSQDSEYSDFEKSLFNGGDKVDFRDYIDTHQLFAALNKEATENTELKYADYRQSLLTLLQHCYGYYYKLMNITDAKTRKLKILELTSAIVGENKTSNVNNSLHAKIIKLTWLGTDIDTKRISTYANLLSNAFTKGNLVNGVTDKNGSLLPEHFLEAVMENGGIHSFSRISAKSIEKKKELAAKGFSSAGELTLDSIEHAITMDEFVAEEENSVAIPIKPIEMESEFDKLIQEESEGESERRFGVVLVKYDSDAVTPVEPLFVSRDSRNIDSLLKQFHSILEKRSKPDVVKPLVMKYKTKEVRAIVTAMELLDVNGGDVDAFLDTIHVDKDKFNHLRLQPA